MIYSKNVWECVENKKARTLVKERASTFFIVPEQCISWGKVNLEEKSKKKGINKKSDTSRNFLRTMKHITRS